MLNTVFPVTSVPTANFLDALAQHAATAMNILYGVPPIYSRRYLIRAISVLAKEAYGPELNFFSTAAGNTTNPATNTFLSRWGFISSMAEQIGATGLYNWYVDGLAIPYRDDDTINTTNPPSLHVIMQNISATAKSADADGATSVTVWLEPMVGIQG